MINLVELCADQEELEDCKCYWGNIVRGHACYCHKEESPYRKCPQYRNDEPYSECVYYKENKEESYE